MNCTTTAKLVRCTTLAIGCIDTSSSGVIDFVDEHNRMVCGLLFTAIAISHLVYYPTMIEVISKRFYEPNCNACRGEQCKSIVVRLLITQSFQHFLVSVSCRHDKFGLFNRGCHKSYE